MGSPASRIRRPKKPPTPRAPRKALLENIENCACFNIRKAARAITQYYDDVFRPLGYGSNQISLLNVLGHMGPSTVGQLAEATLMDRTTVSRNLGPLEKNHLVRIVTGEDRRERRVSLTRKGKDLLRKARPLWKQAQKHILDGLGERRMARLLTDLTATAGVARDG